MSRTLALAVSPGEVWAALEDDGDLIGLRVARDGHGGRGGSGLSWPRGRIAA